jgi:bifunctional non-homologous end joining protein LigD
MADDKLSPYNKKRRFGNTPEPAGEPAGRARKRAGSGTGSAGSHALSFVVQEHHARRLHYDFRLEMGGTLKSWAVPKGPSLDPTVKRLAVHVEDHPLAYGSFEGEIPEGNYGAGTVIVWDQGAWEPEGGEPKALEDYARGKLKFRLHGQKLRGGFMLVRSHMRGSGDKEQWLMIKERDEEARPQAEFDVLGELPGSVLSPTAPPPPHGKKTRSRGVAAVPPDPRATDTVSGRNARSLRTLLKKPAIDGAVAADLPDALRPQLATLVEVPPRGGDWIYEIKFDGYRLLARIERTGTGRTAKRVVRLHTRTGLDWTAKFPLQARALAALDLESGWLDGEAVVLDERDVPSFQALQNAFDTGATREIVYFVFDAPFLNGYDLRDVPLVERRALLRAALESGGGPAEGSLRFSEDFGHDADQLLKSACEMALEGLIGKARDSKYRAGRSPAWIKLKCRRRQEFVIGGWTDPSGSRAEFGALLLGVYDANGDLQYAGRVGTGFDAATLRSVKRELDKCPSTTMPFAQPPRERSRSAVHWVKPDLVAECEFAEWTSDRVVRQASFIGLRGDKPARQIGIETPQPGGQQMEPVADPAAMPGRQAKRTARSRAAAETRGAARHTASAAANRIRGIQVTHPDRVLDPSTGLRKIELVRYYDSVADWMLPHLRNRPVSLVRAPGTLDGQLFFQKHSGKLAMPHATQHPGLDPGHPPLLTIDTPETLVEAAQMGTIELHTWNATADSIEKPDRIVFDLDPDPKLDWQLMLDAAELTRTLLDELGLESFCKTSGGKGLHVVVPIQRGGDWDGVKSFAQAIAQHLANTIPERFSAKMGPQNRVGKIFVDYLRNNRGSSTVAAFSARARHGMGVSTPVRWSEVPKLESGDQWNVRNIAQRFAELNDDPWADYGRTRQKITATVRNKLRR